MSTTLDNMVAFYGPACTAISKHWPERFGTRVPRRIRMLKTARADIPFDPCPPAMKGVEYDCWVNSHGAVAACVSTAHRLGVKPDEFEVVEWHDFEAGKAGEIQ